MGVGGPVPVLHFLPHQRNRHLRRTTYNDGSKEVHTVVKDDRTALGNAVSNPVASEVPLRAPLEVLASTIIPRSVISATTRTGSDSVASHNIAFC